MNVYRRYRLRGASFPPARFDYDDPIEFLQHIFENPITNLHATLDVIRASLPALIEGFASSNEPWNSESGEGEGVADGPTDPPELFEDNLVTHHEAGPPFATVAEGNNTESTPAESPVGHIPLPLPTQTLLPETHTTSQPQSASSSRFSTVMSAHSRQSFIIDISDDDEEEEEEEEESVHNASDTGPNGSIESSDSPPLSAANLLHTDTSHSRPRLEHDVDPPFMTDGRGRVVWSSTRNASGRGTAADGRGSRHSRTRSTPRMACPSPSSALLVSNARGHAWGGQETQGADGKVGGGEQSSGID